MAIDFYFRLATEHDADEIAHVNILACMRVPLWHLMMKDVNPHALHAFLSGPLPGKIKQTKSYRYFLAIDSSTRYD